MYKELRHTQILLKMPLSIPQPKWKRGWKISRGTMRTIQAGRDGTMTHDALEHDVERLLHHLGGVQVVVVDGHRLLERLLHAATPQ